MAPRRSFLEQLVDAALSAANQILDRIEEALPERASEIAQQVQPTPAKRAPAKKQPAKRAPAKKAPAKRAPAKKAPAKRAPAKRESALERQLRELTEMVQRQSEEITRLRTEVAEARKETAQARREAQPRERRQEPPPPPPTITVYPTRIYGRMNSRHWTEDTLRMRGSEGEAMRAKAEELRAAGVPLRLIALVQSGPNTYDLYVEHDTP